MWQREWSLLLMAAEAASPGTRQTANALDSEKARTQVRAFSLCRAAGVVD